MPDNEPRLFAKVISDKKKNNKIDSLTKAIEKGPYFRPIYKDGCLTGIQTSKFGIGEVSRENGLIFLRLKGTQFEMGYQHGYLLADLIQAKIGNPPVNMIEFWSEYIDTEFVNSMAPGLGRLVKSLTAPYSEEASLADRIPDDMFRSQAGVQAGYKKGINDRKTFFFMPPWSYISLDEFILGYIQPDMCNIFLNRTLGGAEPLVSPFVPCNGTFLPKVPIGQLGCTSVAILPQKTADNGLLVGCNFDYDPLAGLWEKNLTVILFDPLPEDGQKPSELQKYLTVTSAGMHTAGLMGVNESGVVFRVHNNFSGETDKGFYNLNDPEELHGQPLLNFGSQILRFAKNIAGNSAELESIIKGIKNGITCPGGITDSPASGWSFIASQMKSDNSSKAIIRETNFNRFAADEIPAPLSDSNKSRFGIITDLPEIKDGGDIRSIWQTNFYTKPQMMEKDIFDRRSSQLDRINRYLRAGKFVRAKYEAGGFDWKDIAGMLADDRDLFIGDKRRMNYKSISSLSTVTSCIFSVIPRAGAKPQVGIHLAGRSDKRTPASWGEYYDVSFDDYASRKNLSGLSNPTGFSPISTDDIFYKAMQIFYDSYTYNTYTELKNVDYSKIAVSLNEIKDLFSAAGRQAELDPVIDFMLGRIHYCDGKFNDAAASFEICLKGAIAFADPHLASVCRLYLARTGFLQGTDAGRERALELLKELTDDDIYYDNLDLTPEMMTALQPYIKHGQTLTLSALKLEYLFDVRIQEMIDDLNKDKNYKADKIKKSLSFSGPEPLLYD
jgi:hypothetical protein